MKYSTHARIKGAPKFEVRARAKEIGLRCRAEGALRATVGPVRARIGQVPVMLAVPFLGGVQKIGAVGPFDISLDDIDLSVQELELSCEGVVGPEGLEAGLDGGIACELEVDLRGRLPGRVARVEFTDPDDLGEVELEEGD